MYVLNVEKNQLEEAEIVKATLKELPIKKDGWQFDWKKAFRRKNTACYILRTKDESKMVLGLLGLKKEDEMLIMDLIELAPFNKGKNKKHDYVAGCLIAFACRESFNLESNYKGFLSFMSKTNLIEWYKKKYGAVQAFSTNRMFIEPENGIKLIDTYLK